jgi:serine/threonine protein kinase
MNLGPGTRLGAYEIQPSLGAGGMGEVYRARDTRLDRTVAIKVMAKHLSATPVALHLGDDPEVSETAGRVPRIFSVACFNVELQEMGEKDGPAVENWGTAKSIQGTRSL